MHYTDDYFEELKNRYIQKLRFTRNKFLNESRNTETAAQAFGLGFLLTSEMELDEFSKRVSENFNLLYEIGRPIEEILNGLVDETRVGYLNELAQRPQDRTVKVRRRLWNIRLPFVSHYETYNYSGELKERFKLKAVWSKENLISLTEARTKEEMAFLFNNLFVKKEYLFQKPIHPNVNIFDPKETNRRK